MRLQVTLRQVRALAAWHHAAHVEGAAVALLDALHRVGAAVQVQARTHLLAFLLMEQSAVIAEHVFAGNHSTIEVDGKTAFVAKVDWHFITFADQI